MTLKLNPCPVCGSEELEEESGASIELYGSSFQHCWIECNDCGFAIEPIELEENQPYNLVREWWNNYADPPLSKF